MGRPLLGDRSCRRNATTAPADLLAFIDVDVALKLTLLRDTLKMLRSALVWANAPDFTVRTGFWIGAKSSRGASAEACRGGRGTFRRHCSELATCAATHHVVHLQPREPARQIAATSELTGW